MIVLRAKSVDFKVTYINLREKPDWFLKISPHGKVPVLIVDEQPLFESNAIAEFLDEVTEPRLHPEDPIKRARNRAWTDFVPTFSAEIRKVYYTKTEAEHLDGLNNTAPKALAKLEAAIAEERGNDGPYFNGPDLCIVDAAYAPFLNRLMMLEDRADLGLLPQFPLVNAWARALVATEAVQNSVADNFVEELHAGMVRNEFSAARFFENNVAAE